MVDDTPNRTDHDDELADKRDIEERVAQLEDLVQRLIEAMKLTNAALMKIANGEKPKNGLILPERMQ